MSRTIGVTLLFIVLLDIFYYNAVSSAGFHVTRVHIRECKCKALPNGKLKCRSLRFPKTSAAKQDLVKCLCSKINQHKFPEFQAPCMSWLPGYPITLV